MRTPSSAYVPFDELTVSSVPAVSAVFAGVLNRRFRRFAGKGESVMVTFRPVIFGSISTCDMPERSSRTFSINCMPNS